MNLIATPRPSETDTGNLFVRLTPQTARRLAQNALFSERADSSDDSGAEIGLACGENVAAVDESDFEAVEFLPLEISIPLGNSRGGRNWLKSQNGGGGGAHGGAKEIDEVEGCSDGNLKLYASYNGGAPARSLDTSYLSTNYHAKDDDIIEIPLDLHPCLRSLFVSTSQLEVSVRPLPDTQVAEQVTFEPLTTSDWELIEMEASALEDGGLLNQITVVYPNQVFPLRLVPVPRGGSVVNLGGIFGGGARDAESSAWVRVVGENFGGLQNQSMDDDDSPEESDLSYSSDDDSEDSFHDHVVESRRNDIALKCVRLMAETEVVVIPKPRGHDRAEPKMDDNGASKGYNDDPIFIPSCPLRVQPTIVDVPESFSKEVAAAHGGSSVDRSNGDCSSKHSASLVKSFLPPHPPLGSVCIHPATLVTIPGYKDCIDKETATSTSSGTSLLVAITIQKAEGPLSQFSTQSSSEGDDRNKRPVAVARIYPSKKVREGHIAMNSYLRSQLNVSIFADWVRVQIWANSLVLQSIDCFRELVINQQGGLHLEPVAPKFCRLNQDLQPWRRPEGYSRMVVQSISSECTICSNEHIVLGGYTLTTDSEPDACDQSSTIFGAGSLVPVQLLQRLGVSLPENLEKCQMVSIKFMSSTSEEFSLRIGAKLGYLVLAKDLRDLFVLTRNEAKEKSRLISKECAFIGDKSKRNTSDSTINKWTDFKELPLHKGSDTFSLIPSSGISTIGLSSTIETIMLYADEIFGEFRNPTMKAPYPIVSKAKGKHALLVVGEEGSGKTHLAVTAAMLLSVSKLCATVFLDCKKLQAKAQSTLNSILEELETTFQEALQKQPSVLILDNLDSIVPNVESGGNDEDGSIQHQQLNPMLVNQVRVISDHLIFLSRSYLSCQHHRKGKPGGLLLICTCKDKDSISAHVQHSGIIYSVVDVPSLDSHQRSSFLYQSIFRYATCQGRGIPHAISRLGKLTDGFRPHDLKIVAARVRNLFHLQDVRIDSVLAGNADDSSDGKISEKITSLTSSELDFDSILDSFTPLSQQSSDIAHNLHPTDWSSIGGLVNAKQSLHDVVIHPMKFKPIYDRAPISLPTGVLLFGPPGCGKSFIVPPLAKSANLNLITCRGPELLDRYIGASEAKVRQLFARATAAAPSMIFFDEFDSLAPQRGSDHTGVTDRVVNQLLTLLDGAERNKKANQIFVVAATSRPDKIDKALLRPGRLEKHVYVGYPESLFEWNSLFAAITKTRHVEEEVANLADQGGLFSLCEEYPFAKDFSSADIKAVMDTAHLLCVHEILESKDCHDEGHKVVIRKRHIVEAFRQTRPSLLPRDREMLNRCYKSFLTSEIQTFGEDSTHLFDRTNNELPPDEGESVGYQNLQRLKTSLK